MKRTKGRNSSRKSSAPTVSAVGLATLDWMLEVTLSSSGTATTDPSVVPLLMPMARLVKGGIEMRTTCGKMM